MAEHLELPRPLCLLRTVGWSVMESLGLPIAAYVLGAWLAGRTAGLLAGLVAIWLTAIVRKLVTGSVPGLLILSAVVLTIQTVAAIATGNLWIFLLHFPMGNLCLCVLFAVTARGPNPLCAKLAAEVISLRQPARLVPGLHRFFQHATLVWAGIFALLAATLGVLLATESVRTFLELSTVATVVLLGAGAGGCALWFRFVLRRLGLGLRFAAA
ncbi:MAG: hypothetical protein ACLPKI_21960 [Streptosporangiaceae bacterium]